MIELRLNAAIAREHLTDGDQVTGEQLAGRIVVLRKAHRHRLGQRVALIVELHNQRYADRAGAAGGMEGVMSGTGYKST